MFHRWSSSLDLARYRQFLAVYELIQDEASNYHRCISRKSFTNALSIILCHFAHANDRFFILDVFRYLLEHLQSCLLWQPYVCVARVPSSDSVHGVNLWLPRLPHLVQVECKLVGAGPCRPPHSKRATQFTEYTHLHVLDTRKCGSKRPIVPWPGKWLEMALDFM